jgi:hypothetical protein
MAAPTHTRTIGAHERAESSFSAGPGTGKLNNRKLHGEIGHVLPAALEEVLDASRARQEIKSLKVSTEPRAVQSRPVKLTSVI